MAPIMEGKLPNTRLQLWIEKQGEPGTLLQPGMNPIYMLNVTEVWHTGNRNGPQVPP